MHIIDKELHNKFKQFGQNRRSATNALLSMLPEIDRRRVWEKEGFVSIYEYALKIAGLSYRLVKKALQVDKKLENMPKLKALIKTEGLSKIEIISKVAKAETERFWAKKAKTMTRDCLQKISLHEKAYQKTMGEPLLGTKNTLKVSEVHNMVKDLGLERLKIDLTERAQKAFFSLKKDLPLLSNKDALEFMLLELIKLKQTVSSETTSLRQKSAKIKISPRCNLARKSKQLPSVVLGKNKSNTISKARPSRHIPNAIKKYISKTCSFPGCSLPRDHIHHPILFSRNPNHLHLKPLCKVHHKIMHQGLIKNQIEQSEKWIYSSA